MEKKMENGMETGIIADLGGIGMYGDTRCIGFR